MPWVRSSPLGLGLGLALGAASPAAATSPVELRPVRAELTAVAGLSVELTPNCRAQVLAELTEGRRLGEGCRADRELVGRALVRRQDAFGFVERREVDLARLRLVLGVARRCRQWPLRDPDRDVLRRTDVDEAGCRLRRHQGELSLVLIDRAGRRHEPLPPVRADRDGRVSVRFGAVDRALRALGKGSLDGYARLELGDGGWAGHVDLDELLRLRADWHLTWLQRGRGAPGLFVVQHPRHPRADTARTLAADAALARQERDAERVEEGELPPQVFLDRYPRSPYRRRVEAWMRARARRQDEPQRPERPASAAPGGGRRGGTTGGMGP
ncbi:hypothetical protein [Paraliomyxa miuraensis]|uniref:hypothetical protein n=1 Tax=Paraliomyxa miuraensis TaxID=376150 RepID=UPI002252C2EB|nr:hypothetical protein [Paraliomyxa miuraensis]MCX4244357.1 hypothetical protein [Paraliomyxa miuraensis]